MQWDELYRDHLHQLEGWLDEALSRAQAAGHAVDGAVFHSGRPQFYHADDREIVFIPAAHFRRWVPSLDGPEHLVVARPGAPIRVFQVQPADYWYDTTPPPPSFWEGAVDLRVVSSFAEAAEQIATLNPASLAYVGPSPQAAHELEIRGERIEPEELIAALDWFRALKTPFEVAASEVAGRSGAAGHAGARDAFLAGGTELDVYHAYLQGAGQIDQVEIPFGIITAFDAKAAILHYQHKRGPDYGAGRLLLMDAGTSHLGYASDITRTWVRDDTPSEVRQLIEGVDALERELVAMVRPGLPYPDIHFAAHRGAAELLVELGVLRVSVEEALADEITRTFLPHGVGHHLGLQVHDVGGRMAAMDGTIQEPPEGHPHLRTTRPLAAGHLVTIEPGIYFIDMLLAELKGRREDAIDWDAVERFAPWGGVRIEDDILCTEDGYRDLTRAHIPGPRGE